ncbi:MAG: hypothetical protein LIO77_11170 [Rikenellaceae bacterium]|nr:hypothetical protein [Rikenellaceae bacterium]
MTEAIHGYPETVKGQGYAEARARKPDWRRYYTATRNNEGARGRMI